MGAKTRIVPAVVLLAAAAAAGCGAAGNRDQPATPPLPRTGLSVEDRAAWRARLRWPDGCEQAFQASRATGDAGLVFMPVAAGVSVVQVLCAAGAYQPSFVYIRYDETAAPPASTLLEFATYRSPDGTTLEPAVATELPGEAFLDAGARELAVLNLFRQTADCGVWTRYSLTGARPQLREARARVPCPAGPGEPARPEGAAPPAGWEPIDGKQGG